MVRLSIRRIAARLYIVLESQHSAADDRADIGIAADKLGGRGERQSKKIMEDEHLAVALRTCADTDSRNLQLARDHGCHLTRNAFQHYAARSCALQRNGIMHELFDRLQSLALHVVATHGVQRLWRQPDVSHYGDFG